VAPDVDIVEAPQFHVLFTDKVRFQNNTNTVAVLAERRFIEQVFELLQ